MSRILYKSLAMLSLLTALGMATSVRAQEVVIMPPGYVATATPVYFEGRAAYWYNDHWVYRMGDHWEAYHEEPVYLRKYRADHPPVHRYYEGRGYTHAYRR